LRKKGITTFRTKIKGAVFLTVLISSYLYITFTQQIFSNVIINGPFRKQLTRKIRPSTGLANGTKAANLTLKEYQTIASLAGFPMLTPAAHNIQYEYEFDGFLPDYSLSLIYDLPSETPVATYDSSKGDYLCSQSVRIIDNVKRVTYSEALH
jgi:hypothetical protein